LYLGSLARAGAQARQRTPAQWALYGVDLLATIAVTVIITRIAARIDQADQTRLLKS